MSKNKNYKKKNRPGNKVTHNSIIHGNNLYTYRIKSNGKRHNKKSCIYYDGETQKCTNNKCHVSICTTAYGCTVYKRKEIKNKLSKYDENYIQQPLQSGIHDNSIVSSMSENIGTPVHETFLKSKDKRRHKTRCIYFNKVDKMCRYLVRKCIGSSHCNKYHEKIK